MSIEIEKLTNIIEAALLAFGQPLNVDRLMSLFGEEEEVSRQDIREAIQILQQSCEGRSVELVEVGSGFRYQARKDYASWVSKLWEEKPPRYSRALLETLVLVAYRQPITRAEIEDIRGVSVSSHIMKTLQERDWVRIVGHKDVPGKPALYATTKAFLDYFNLKSLEELPSLMEIRDLDKISAEIDRQSAEASQAGEEPRDLIEDEDIERLMPDGEADHGEGIEDNLEENEEAGLEVPAQTADSGQPLENAGAEAHGGESMQTEASEEFDGEELVAGELETLSDQGLDQSTETLVNDSNEQKAISEEELSGERVSEVETVSADMVEEEGAIAESDEESIVAKTDSAEDDASERENLQETELREAVPEEAMVVEAMVEETVLEQVEETVPEQEPVQEMMDAQPMERYGVSDNSPQGVNGGEETSPVEADAHDAEIEAKTDHNQTFDAQATESSTTEASTTEASTTESSEDHHEPHFSTANYGLRPGQRDTMGVNAGEDDTGQDDNEIAEDEQHSQRLSAAESNS